MEALNKFKAWAKPKLEWLRDSWLEVRHRVTWPTREEVWGTTRVVIVAVIVFAVIVGIMDLAMYQLMQRLLFA